MLVEWSLFDPLPSWQSLESGHPTDGELTIDWLKPYSVEAASTIHASVAVLAKIARPAVT
jgi:hypothetical protein